MFKSLKLAVIISCVVAFAAIGCKKEAVVVAAAPDVVQEKVVETAGKAVATVNGVEISRAAFDEEVGKVTQNGVRKIPEDRMVKIEDNIVNRLIEEELISQEIKKQAVEVTPDEIEAQYQEYKARFKGDEQFDNYLKHGKVTPEVIKERLSKSFALTKLLEKLGKLAVSDEDIQTAYTTGIKMYTDPEQVRGAHILIRLSEKEEPGKEAEAKKKIEKALSRLNKGEDFATVAKELSEDATTAPKGGDLGFFRAGVMVPAFEKAAFALKENEYTKQAVRTPFGLHIIKSFEKKAERVKPIDEVREKIATSLKNRAIFKARRELIRSLRDAAKIEKFIGNPVEGPTGDQPPARANGPEGAVAPAPAPAEDPAREPAPAPAPAAAEQNQPANQGN
jgi:parvulin-like peptidyl-prolyl isomerase